MAIQTPPDAAADSYTDVAAADAYHLTRLNSSVWSSATVPDKESALKQATRRLEAEDWVGEKADALADNSLRWPRSLVENADGQYEDDTLVPLAIQQATAELGLELLKAAADETSTASESPTSEIVVGPIKLKLDTDKETAGSSTVTLSGDVEALIAPYRTSSLTGALVRA